jgi:uncharacterized membrane protein
MFVIAPGMPPHVCPRQGRRRPTPRFCAAGEVIDFALVMVCGLNSGSIGRVAGRAGGNARHRPKLAATRLSPAGPPEAHAEILCRMRNH